MAFRVASAASLLCLLTVIPLPSGLLAQQDNPPAANIPMETLHVYVNRMQFPTLLIDKQERAVAHPKLKDFDITLDSGKPFHPSGMHIEANDPLAIAVLLDLSGGEEGLLDELPNSLAALVPQALLQHDRLYFYALDCRLIGLPSPVPPDAAAIRSNLATISAAPVHASGGDTACSAHPRLWDAITIISHALAPIPARHVLLVVSRAKTDDNVTSRVAMDHAVNFDGTAVFVVRDIIRYYADHGIRTGVTDEVRRVARDPMFALTKEASPVDLCIRSGGFVLNVIPGTLPARLHELISLLRGRYVLEFARPNENFVGWHEMQVSVTGVPYALATGTSAPVEDTNVPRAPDTLPVKPSPAVLGSRQVLEPKTHDP